MFSGSSALRVGLKQQRTLSPAQTNRLNVTLIWKLNRIFLTRRTLRASAERVGFLVLKREKRKKISRNVLSNGCRVRAKLRRVLIYTARNRTRL